ncbi:MAG TPA: ABC transporter permease [Firmicutes bacterium]|nr:ABC transporter permease [Bacillota bacterium]
MKAYLLLVLANIREFSRDLMTLFWFLAFPLIFILLFGAIFSGNGDLEFQVGLAVEDQGPAAAGIAEAMKAVPIFQITQGDREAMLAALKEGKLRAVIVLPEDLSAAMMVGQRVDLPVYYDAAQQTSREIVLSVMKDMTAELDRRLTGRPQLIGIQAEPIQAGRKMRDIDYLLPGILSMSLMQLGLFGTFNFVSMRQRKVFKRFGATPLPKWTLLAAEITVRLMIAVIQTLVIVFVGRLVFDVQMVGNWAVLIALVMLGATVFVSMGYMIAGFAKTEDGVQGIIQTVQFPMMFLSGIFFPVEFMPAFLRPVMTAMPLSYLGDLLRQEMVGASAMHSLAVNLGVLGGFTLVSLALAVRFFRWE